MVRHVRAHLVHRCVVAALPGCQVAGRGLRRSAMGAKQQVTAARGTRGEQQYHDDDDGDEAPLAWLRRSPCMAGQRLTWGRLLWRRLAARLGRRERRSCVLWLRPGLLRPGLLRVVASERLERRPGLVALFRLLPGRPRIPARIEPPRQIAGLRLAIRRPVVVPPTRTETRHPAVRTVLVARRPVAGLPGTGLRRRRQVKAQPWLGLSR